MFKKIWRFLNSYKADLIFGFVGVLCSALFLGSLSEQGSIDFASVFGGAMLTIGIDIWSHGIDGFFSSRSKSSDSDQQDQEHRRR